MKDYFETIVVPVYRRQNTDVIIRKVLELSNDDSVIHLICGQSRLAESSVFQLRLRAAGIFKNQADACHRKLLELKERIIKEKPAVKVNFSIVEDGSLKDAVVDKSIKEEADLIIIGKSLGSRLLSSFDTAFPHQLAKQTSSAVLLVSSGAISNPAKIVIVPILSNVTYNRMGVLAALCKKRRFAIHLVTFSGGTDTTMERPSALLRVYHWLKTSLHCSVECKALPAHNKLKTILHYAENTNAEIILIDPELYEKTDWWHRHFASFWNVKSKVSLLAVKPIGPAISY